MKVFYQKVHKRELTLATAEIKPHSSNPLSDVRFFLPLSECMEEVWKGDMGAKGGAEKAESESTEKEGAREEKEDKRHDGGEL